MGGTDWPHELGYIMERPNGFGEFLFVRFRTPMYVRTARGMRRCKAGTCLIYAPGHPQWYQGDGVGFRDDWCHVNGSDVRPCLERAALPLDTLFTPRNTRFFPLLIEEIRTELQRQEAFWRESVALAVARLIFLLGRGLSKVDDREGGVDVVRRERLRRVREQVHERLADRWTVAKMARPGKTESHQAISMLSFPAVRMFPQLGVGGWTPRPRNDRPDSVSTAPATPSTAAT